MNQEKVDALFSGEPPPEPVDVEDRVRRLKMVLAIALPLDALGILCWTGVPGALLTMWAWSLADGETQAIEAGLYTPEGADRVMRLRSVAFWALVFCVISLMAQAYLLGTPFYESVFARVLGLFS